MAMATVYPDVVWQGVKDRLEDTPIPIEDRVAGVDGFKAVNSLAELEAISADRVAAVLLTEGPFHEASRPLCVDSIRLAVVIRYGLYADSLARALRDQPLVNARLVTLGLSVAGVSPPVQVTGPTWDYTSLAGDNAVLVSHSLLVVYTATRPEVT